ncbi:MAG TPA: hypothetical protein VFD04_16715 [Actinomycetes bacterium]|jgi:hypothetical protein|nr:hypothetical protein [Actinomycetes bacterium]
MLSGPEGQVLMLLDSAGTTLTSRQGGQVRWALDAADVCVLLELGAELAGAAVDPAVSDRLARLLGGEVET